MNVHGLTLVSSFNTSDCEQRDGQGEPFVASSYLSYSFSQIVSQAISYGKTVTFGCLLLTHRQTTTPLARLIIAELPHGLLKARLFSDGDRRGPYYGSIANVRTSSGRLYYH